MRQSGAFLIVGFFLFVLFLFNCSEEPVGSAGSPPVIDSILTTPENVNPGSEIILKAIASDAEGDPLSYTWSTYPRAGFFSDSTAPVCTMLVNKSLSGGMKMKVTLEIDDGNYQTEDSIWISLIPGKKIFGHVYYNNTSIPVPGTIVSVKRLIDTSEFRGNFVLNDVPPGDIYLRFMRDKCIRDSLLINVVDSAEIDFYVDCPDLTRTMSGIVQSTDGTPLSNMEIILLNKDSSESQIIDTTDLSGQFILDGVPVGNRLFSIRERGNPDHNVLTDTVALSPADSTEVSLTAYTRHSAFISNGLDQFSYWHLSNDGAFADWTADSARSGYSFNPCDGQPGRLFMIQPVLIPNDAIRVGWSVEIDLEGILCYFIGIIDGEIDEGASFENYGGSISLERIMDNGDNYHGRDFQVDFYALKYNEAECGLVVLKKFELFYYK